MHDSWNNDEPMDKRLADGFGDAGNCHHSNLHGRTLPSPTDSRNNSGHTFARNDVRQQTTATARCGMAREEATDGVSRHKRGEGKRENSCFRCADS